MFYKITFGLVAIPPDLFLKQAHTRTRHNHQHCYFKPYASTDYYKYSFFIWTIPLWNNLPPAAAEAESLEQFRSELSRLSLSTI
jgi:hypothetical protein